MARTKIEWTNDGYSWNPVTGCTKVSPGCDNCYAESIAERFRGGAAFPDGFDVTLRPNRLTEPVSWEPGLVFVNSMSDLFHEEIPPDFLEHVWDTMTKIAPHHQYLILTKRPGRMKTFVEKRVTAPGNHVAENIWLGVSIETMEQAWRADTLRDVPAHIRFISAEPLLGSLRELNLDSIDWLIAGGESGTGARCPDGDWFRELRDRCMEEDVAYFFKQWGAYNYEGRRVGKKNAGRHLDGRTWDEYPTRYKESVLTPRS